MSSVAARPISAGPPTNSRDVGERFAEVDEVLREFACGRAVVVHDDVAADAVGYLVWAAESAVADMVAFAVRHTSGFLCVAMSEADADRLDLPPMAGTAGRTGALRYAVTVDGSKSTGTGISARDRSDTMRLLSRPDVTVEDLSRPGHVVPVRAHRAGLLGRSGIAEAAVDLAGLAGLRPFAGLAALVAPERQLALADADELRGFASVHGLRMTTVSAVIDYRRRAHVRISRSDEVAVRLAGAEFAAMTYQGLSSGRQQIAFVLGDISSAEEVLVRVERGCVLGETLGPAACRCHNSRQVGLRSLATEGRGVLIYIRPSQSTGAAALTPCPPEPEVGDGPALIEASGEAGQTLATDVDAVVRILDDLGMGAVRLLISDSALDRALSRGALPAGGIKMAKVVAMTDGRQLRPVR